MTRTNRFLTGASLTTLTLGALVLPATPAQAAPQDSTFTPNGSDQSYTVSTGVCSVQFTLRGGAGHSPTGGGAGGKGGSVQLTVPAASGNTFTIKPGQKGTAGVGGKSGATASGGGGGNGGGGASAILDQNGDKIAIAAGGGGGGNPPTGAGGGGGWCRGCRRTKAAPAPPLDTSFLRLDDHGVRRWWRDDDRARHRRREPRGSGWSAGVHQAALVPVAVACSAAARASIN